MKTLADLLPRELPKLTDLLPEPPPNLPVPKFIAHKLGWNPRRVTYWPQTEDPERWRELVDEMGAWAAKRAASFAPVGDWETLRSRAQSLKETVLARM